MMSSLTAPGIVGGRSSRWGGATTRTGSNPRLLSTFFWRLFSKPRPSAGVGFRRTLPTGFFIDALTGAGHPVSSKTVTTG